jgi:hypothetical protein
MLNGLKPAERTAELHTLARMSHGQVACGVECTDDLHASRPGAAAGQFVAHPIVEGLHGRRGQVECDRAARFTRQVVPVLAQLADHRDVKRLRGARSKQHGGIRPRHAAGGSGDPAVPLLGVGHRDGERPVFGYVDAGRIREPRCEQVCFGNWNRPRVLGQTREHDRRLRRPRIPGTAEPAQTGLLEVTPQRLVERIGHTVMAQPRLVGPAADVVDELLKFVHRTPMPLATTPRSTSLVPPRSVNSGECNRAAASRARSRSASGESGM